MSDAITGRIAEVLESRGLVQHAQIRAAIAEAVVETLGLREELRYLEDGYGGQSVDADGRVTTFSRASTRTRRYVTRWEKADG